MSRYTSLPSESSGVLPLSTSTAPSSHRSNRFPPQHASHSNSEDTDDYEDRKGWIKHEQGEEDLDFEDVDQIMPISSEKDNKGSRLQTIMDKLPVRPRTIVFSSMSLLILIPLFVFFHPSRPFSSNASSVPPISHSASDYYSGAPLSIGLFDPSLGQLSPNPLEDDATFSDVPFAKVGQSWDGKGIVPEWAGGDGGAKAFEKGFLKGHHGEGTSKKRWNGTHWFDPTVLLISLDGIRADYLDLGVTPNLVDTSRPGIRAEYLKPVFPTLTFPNHWSILTGLYPSSHGIVANEFYAPDLDREFDFRDAGKSWDPRFWKGEPIWATALSQSLRVASLHFPGPPKLSGDGALRPTYWYPYVPHTHPRKKLDKLSQWFDMGFEKRPNWIQVYVPEIDQEGHKVGTVVGEDEKVGNEGVGGVEKSLKGIDDFVGGVFEILEERNLTGVVDVVIVGDHGMTRTNPSQLVYLDEILGSEGFNAITHKDGWPSAGLRFDPTLVEESDMLDRLRQAAENEGSGFEVYTKDDMPKEWHYDGNERIAPIYCVPKLGWTITSHREIEENGGKYSIKGNHGYDPSSSDMHSIFLAYGPFASRLKSIPSTSSSTSSQTMTIPGFDNVELYELFADFLEIPVEARSHNNATSGFWDQYLNPFDT